MLLMYLHKLKTPVKVQVYIAVAFQNVVMEDIKLQAGLNGGLLKISVPPFLGKGFNIIYSRKKKSR